MHKMCYLIFSSLFLLGCEEKQTQSDESSSSPTEPAPVQSVVPTSDLELRILDVVLIDPRTGNPPPKDAQLRFAAPTRVKFPMIVEKPDRETDEDPYAFRVTWFDEPSGEAVVVVVIEGFKPLEIGLKHAKREKNQAMLFERIQRTIKLEPVEAE